MAPAEIRRRERAGQSLAQIADGTNGRSATGLIAALVHERATAIGTLEKAGRLTSAEASARIATLPRRVTSAVEHEPLAQPRGPTG